MDTRRKTTVQFIEEAKNVHGNKYDYSKVEYKNNKTKICIICPEHGEFWQRPHEHLIGQGCKLCGIKRFSSSRAKTTEQFIEEAKKVHGDKYDYSKVKYKNNSTKVCIICPEHGEFWQNPNDHLKGSNCPKCYGNVRKTTEQFIEDARKIHGDKYDYSKVDYKNAFTKVCIICPKHGEFWQKPNIHLSNHGCPHCRPSRGEEKISEYLKEYNIKFYHDVSCFDWLKSNKGYRMQPDFYLPDYNLIIEYDGEQHFKPVKAWGGEERFKAASKREKLKDKLYLENGLKVLHIPYTEYKNIESILTEELNLRQDN